MKRWVHPAIRTTECPRCFAPPGVRCVYVEKKTRRILYSDYIHASRLREHDKLSKWFRKNGDIFHVDA